MTKTNKKLLSLVVAVMYAMCILVSAPVTAYAATGHSTTMTYTKAQKAAYKTAALKALAKLPATATIAAAMAPATLNSLYKTAATAVLRATNSGACTAKTVKMLTNYKRLAIAKAQYVKNVAAAKLVVDTTAAAAVTAQIALLPLPAALVVADEVKVVAARTAYTALSAEAKVLVTNVATLTAAELKIVELKAVVEVKTVKMIGMKKVEVTFNTPVDTTKAVVKVKKGAAIYSASATWNATKDVATVTTVMELPAADYSVEVTGLTTTLTKAFTVLAEAATTIEFASTKLADATAAAQVSFVVKNQYGEDMDVLANATGVAVSGYNVTQAASATVAQGANKYFTVNTFATPAAFVLNDVVRVIVSYAGVTASVNMTVVNPAAPATIDFGGITLATNDTRLNVSDLTVKLTYTLMDQYGAAIDFTAAAGGAMPQTLEGVQFITSNAAVISNVAIVDDVNGRGQIVLTLAGAGTAIITAAVNATGDLASTSITVNADGVATSAAVNAPTMLVASQDAAFDLGMTITDQYGDVVKSVAGLTIADADLNNDLTTDITLTAVNSVTKMHVDLSTFANADVNATTSYTVDVMKGATKIGTITLVVEPEAVASQITNVLVPTTLENSAVYAFAAEDFTVLDQYGRTFEGTLTLAEKTDVTGVATFLGTTVTADAALVGTAVYTATFGAATFDFNIGVVATADVKTYTLTQSTSIYKSASAAYHVTPTLVGKTEGGTEVVLVAGKVTSWTTSNPAIAKITAGKVEGVAVGTADISAWAGATKLATVTVTVTDVAPIATTVAFTATAMDISNGDNLADILSIKDQYGVNIVATELAKGTIIDAGNLLDTAAGLTFGDADAAGTDDITFITQNGLVKTATVTVAP